MSDDRWQLPLLDRMREDFARVTTRDADNAMPGLPPRRVFRLGLGAALAVVIALVALVFVDSGGRPALADVRDAPAAVARAGAFTFRTDVKVRGRASSSSLQTGTVDLSSKASQSRLFGESSRGVERVVIGQQLYFRAIGTRRGVPSWSRVSLLSGAAPGEAALPGLAGPISVAAIEALRNPRNVKVTSAATRIDGFEVKHYRLSVSAAEFIATRTPSTTAELRDVPGQVDVWLDNGDLPRRVRARFSKSDDSFIVDTRYADYGRAAAIQTPHDALPTTQSAALTTADPVVTNLRVAFGA